MVSSIRMGGLVSGLDTESIVKNLMKAEKAPLNKLVQKKQSEEWRRDQFREMNALLFDLKNKTFDMKLQGTYQKKVLSSNNDTIVSAKQKGTPGATTYNVNVTDLPVPAKAASVKFTAKDVKDGTTPIGGDAFDFKIGSATGSSTINVTATDTISSIIAKVNAVSSTTGVTANYLQDDKSITFTTTTSGDSSTISIDPVIGADFDASNKLGLSKVMINKNSAAIFDPLYKYQIQVPKDAKLATVNINGIPYKVNSSTFTFDGVEFNIKAIGSTQINLKPDEDAIYKSIKEYVDKYNEIIAKINKKVDESTSKGYKPLLAEEKEAMSDKQIELWEEKAKSGLLSQDSTLSNALSQMRLSLVSKVNGTGIDTKYDSLSEIGITSGDYTENGKLYISESKLRKAISENGSGVMELFTKVSTSADATSKFSESGLAQRMYDQITTTMTKLTDKAGSIASLVDKSVIGEGLNKINKQISSWETRLAKTENRYWAKFTAMETAMSKANSQSSWLTQQMG